MMMSVIHQAPLPVYHFPAETASDTLLHEAWQTWAMQALPGAGECRDIAVERLKDCLLHRSSTLNLSQLQLTTLPTPLPDFLTKLTVKNNQLSCIPDTLPSALMELNVSANHLQHLPECFPPHLKKLDVRLNALVTLPDTLPPSLRFLYVSGNQLVALPDTLPALLQVLYVNRNGLHALPDCLPNALTELRASGNQLTRLPDILPTSLILLNVSFNRLSFLPADLPLSLKTLNVHDNQLTLLPDTLPDGLRILTIRNNPFIALPDTFPGSLTSIDLDVVMMMHRYGKQLGFLEKIACWDKHIDEERWGKIQSEAHADDFADFLYKLYRGKNCRSHTLRHRVVNWLTYIAKDDCCELRKDTFLLARVATESCVDRASYYFNSMHILMVEAQLLRSNASLAEIIDTIKSNFKLKILTDIAEKHIVRRRAQAPGFAEDLEIYLAYQCILREPLSLPIYTELQFSGIAKLSEEDINNARESVIEAEKRDFMRYWLTESTLWSNILEKWDAAKMKGVDAQHSQAVISEDFNAAVMAALDEKGIAASDSDADCNVRKAFADQLRYQQRYQLTQLLLAEKHALFLLDKYSPATS